MDDIDRDPTSEVIVPVVLSVRLVGVVPVLGLSVNERFVDITVRRVRVGIDTHIAGVSVDRGSDQRECEDSGQYRSEADRRSSKRQRLEHHVSLTRWI
ncbi:hypothetical protein GJ629_05790 [Halapricum sp. CBA1109]|uniref:hypothetical protein n=1 Tax=Halapricum sp. CBA1109 TaxID=2668068 RepID=UPI0012F737C3|nr:hypothetical protein [Halapricum sp. CBA1109]MUV89468.1 hypothetical protein [Halapricum sp. CBA1109]